MGNEYNRLRTQKPLFVPMLCSRPSVIDVNQRKSVLRPESFAGDPLSPRITCIGQLKKRSDSNRNLHFNKTTINNNGNSLKLKKPLSGKNFITAASISVEVQTRNHRVRNGGGWPEKGFKNEKQGLFSAADVDVDVDVDPPLPVIKKVKKMEDGAESLWKRRSGDVALRSLELQP